MTLGSGTQQNHWGVNGANLSSAEYHLMSRESSGRFGDPDEIETSGYVNDGL